MGRVWVVGEVVRFIAAQVLYRRLNDMGCADLACK